MKAEQQVHPSKIHVVWRRGFEHISFKQPLVILALGVRGGGKSVFLETVGEHYLANGGNVFDLFGASSGEGLAWLRSPWVEKEDLSVLLITGDDVSVSCSWPTKSWKDMTLSDLERNRIVISSTPLYSDKNEEFKSAGKLLDLLFQRQGWSQYINMIVRESANLFYSRMKIRQDMLQSKAEGIYLIRESRHHGLSLSMDTQKLTSVDSDFRALCDYIIIKSQGVLSLPSDYRWLYGFYRPEWLRNMKPYQFGILTSKGSIGAGTNGLPFWHKRPREHLLRVLGINIESGVELTNNQGDP